MEESSAVSASASSTSKLPFATSSLFASLPNISHCISVKLNGENYMLWRAQFLPFLNTYKLMGLIDGSVPCPPLTIFDPLDPTKSI